MMDLKFKAKLHAHCVALIDGQANDISSAIANQKEGNQGTSSAGDKHNTEQAMQHLELEKKHIQLATVMQNQQTLQKINPTKASNAVNTGALVKMNKGVFYFSVAIGKVKFENQDIMLLSIGSPIGQIMRKLKKGESKSFNGQEWSVLDIV